MFEEEIKYENGSLREKVKIIAGHLGLDPESEKTLIKMHSRNEETKEMTLKRGNWNNKNEPWFILDENSGIDVLVSVESLIRLIDSIRDISSENFNLKLEKAIWQQIPTDFDDVWIVAMDKIKEIATSNPEQKALAIDVEKIIKEIKNEHPNLFVNMQEMVYKEMEIDK